MQCKLLAGITVNVCNEKYFLLYNKAFYYFDVLQRVGTVLHARCCKMFQKSLGVVSIATVQEILHRVGRPLHVGVVIYKILQVQENANIECDWGTPSNIITDARLGLGLSKKSLGLKRNLLA